MNIQVSLQKKYFSLRNEIDKLCQKLEREHSKNINCKQGCSSCCMDFSIFPAEFHSILKETERVEINVNCIPAEGKCPFLAEELCSIYEYRPVICRTHGLPLLYMGEDDWQLSVCELNFTGMDTTGFTESNTFPQDLFNSKMFMLNREFIEKMKEIRYKETDLLPLSELGRRILAQRINDPMA